MRSLFVVLALAVSACAFADDSAIRGVGGSIRSLDEHPSVRMVSENVYARLSPDEAQVRCEFVFRNNGNATTVKMGFPETGGGDISLPEKTWFKDFRAYVDGRRVKTQRVLASRARDNEYLIWHVKNVRFGAGQTRRIIDEYRSGLGGDITGARSFAYTLKSGSSWKGTIGRAVVTVDLSDVPMSRSTIPRSYSIRSAEPKGYARTGRRLIWTMRDFEPKANVSVSLVPHTPAVYGEGVWLYRCPVYYVRGGTAMASVRVLAERDLGPGKPGIVWDPRARTGTLSFNGHSLKLESGSRKAVLDGTKEVKLPRAPTVVDGSFVVPIASVVSALGGSASFDGKSGNVALTLPWLRK